MARPVKTAHEERKLNAKQFRALLMLSTGLPYGQPQITTINRPRWPTQWRVVCGPIDITAQVQSLRKRRMISLGRINSANGMFHIQLAVTKRGQEYLDARSGDHIEDNPQAKHR